jgi:DNA-binding CsgD family transcriptional regulator
MQTPRKAQGKSLLHPPFYRCQVPVKSPHRDLVPNLLILPRIALSPPTVQIGRTAQSDRSDRTGTKAAVIDQIVEHRKMGIMNKKNAGLAALRPKLGSSLGTGLSSNLSTGLGLGLVLLQCLCGGYFTWEILASIFDLPSLPLRWQTRELVELGACAGLILGAFTSLRLSLSAQAAKARADHAHRLTAGEFTDAVEEFFARIELTEAERDVTWLMLKGMSTSEIAALRETKQGTVKAQSTAIYRKAGVSGKSQLFSQLVEELLM